MNLAETLTTWIIGGIAGLVLLAFAVELLTND